MYFLEALKASGLYNLNFYSRIIINGDIGRVNVEMIIIGGRYNICFGYLNCQVAFVLFVVGNSVSDVVYVIRV